MKVSLAWIFDHIDSGATASHAKTPDSFWRSINVEHLAKRFNQVTAEIEQVEKFTFDFSSYALATINSVTANEVTVTIPEWKQAVALAHRSDIQESGFDLSECCLMVRRSGPCDGADKKTDNAISWVTLNDLGLDKDGLMPLLDSKDLDLAGGWKKKVESEDVLFEVDNKSLTHRPDMWGHRGFAREISAYMDLTFKEDASFLANIPVGYYRHTSAPTAQTPFAIINEAPQACSLFSGLYISSIKHRPSNLFVALRLIRVGARPINGIVDLSNYVMFDWSKPTHAYDADKLAGKKVIIRAARPGETLTLLGGEKIELHADDTVIADEHKAICLAGVKGGQDDSVNAQTKAVFFESANFDSGYIRKSSLRHKNRNDSSTRFEKTLDPNLAVESVRRFINLAEQFGFEPVHAGEIICVGELVEPAIIEVTHSYLERAAGVALSSSDVIQPLERLGFSVAEKKITAPHTFGPDSLGEDSLYYVAVPTYRGSKDVKIKDDIVEEVVRMYGFDRLPPLLPSINKKPEDLTRILRLRRIKEYLAYGVGMTEQQNYAMFDDKFLSTHNIQANSYLSIKNPVSEQYSRMVSTLIMGLCKNIVENFVDHDSLAFFEVAKIWRPVSPSSEQACSTAALSAEASAKEGVAEKKSLAGIFFEKRKPVDFYACKAHVEGVLRLCGVQGVEWRKLENSNCQLDNQHQVADLYYEGKIIGRAGRVNRSYLAKLDVLPESDAFMFQLDADFLLSYKAPVRKLKPLAKYQENSFDLSFFVPLAVTTGSLEKLLARVDGAVSDVTLVDFFEREEWQDKRSLAFRLWIRHPDKTMTKEEIEEVRVKAINAVTAAGATLRA